MQKPSMTVGMMVAAVTAATFSLVAYYPIKKWLATRSMNEFLAPLRSCAVPMQSIKLKNGEFRPSEAFAGRLLRGADVTVIIGGWDRVRLRSAAAPVIQRVAGALVSLPPPGDWLARYHSPELLLATSVPAGAFIVWSNLPTGESMRRHMRELDDAMSEARERLPAR